MHSSAAPSSTPHLPCLDGVRAFLALWVFGGHLCFAVGASFPLLDNPANAVNGFMLLSGLLMTLHWPPTTPSAGSPDDRAMRFWIRRFFRIAPLYYVLLAVSFWLTPQFLQWSSRVQEVFPAPWASALASYDDPTDHTLSLGNVFSHLTFLFGLFPAYAANNALPDWSLSLEMQFYLLFPLLVRFATPARMLPFICAAALVALGTGMLFGLYLHAGPLGNFPQPSFLPFRLHFFAAGMAMGRLATLRHESASSTGPLWLALALSCAFLPKPVIACLIVITLLVCCPDHWTRPLASLLSCRPLRFLGDLSYGVYLVHQLILMFILSHLVGWDYFVQAPPSIRLALACFITVPPVLLVSFILHHGVELPGIRMGKRIASAPLSRLITGS